MKISGMRLKLIAALLTLCVSPSAVTPVNSSTKVGNFFRRARQSALACLLRTIGFKDALLHHIKSRRLQYPEWNNLPGASFITAGADFTFVEYCHRTSPPSTYLHDILNRAVHALEEEYQANSGFRTMSSELDCIYDYNNHYLLLTAIARVTKAERIAEIGTAAGSSLWSWLRSEHLTSLSTWDVVSLTNNTGWFHNKAHQKLVEESIYKDKRWTQYVEDLAQPEVWAARTEILVTADIIFIDGPHNGAFESVIFDHILQLKNDRNILLIFDDIWVSSMVDFWRSIQLPKLDATPIGHQSGTGLALLLPYGERCSSVKNRAL